MGHAFNSVGIYVCIYVQVSGRSHDPGSYELPIGAKRLHDRQQGAVDAIVCLGCLVKGGTMHFEYGKKS